MAPVAGIFIEQDGMKWAFYGCFVVGLFLLAVIQVAPIQRVRIQSNVSLALRKVFTEKNVILFFFVVIVGGMGLSTIHNYLFIYLDGLGAGAVMKGWALTIATLSELVFMFLSDKLLKKWKAGWLIFLALVLLVLRFVLYSIINSPQIALMVQLLHGPTFGIIWVAGVNYVGEIAPQGLENTLQGLFTGVVMGLGSGLGAFVGGVFYSRIGFSQMFLAIGVIVLLSSILFVLGDRRLRSFDL
jgi:PPP family 3-phenylpropionic acid transporter